MIIIESVGKKMLLQGQKGYWAKIEQKEPFLLLVNEKCRKNQFLGFSFLSAAKDWLLRSLLEISLANLKAI